MIFFVEEDMLCEHFILGLYEADSRETAVEMAADDLCIDTEGLSAFPTTMLLARNREGITTVEERLREDSTREPHPFWK